MQIIFASGWLPSSQTSSSVLTVSGSEPSVHVPSALVGVASPHTMTNSISVGVGVGVCTTSSGMTVVPFPWPSTAPSSTVVAGIQLSS